MVLFPAALGVDRSGVVPDSHFAVLAKEGFYGLVAEPEIGGSAVDMPELTAIVETLAGGCLSTAWTWLQHHGVVLALTDTSNIALWAEYLVDLTCGRMRAGVAVSGAVAQPATLTGTVTDDGFRLSGTVPMVSGWGMIDLLLLSAVVPGPQGDLVVSGLVETRDLLRDRVVAEPLSLGGVRGANVVRLRFENYLLPTESLTRSVTRREFAAGGWMVTRLYGALALGLATRCCRLLATRGKRQLAGEFRSRIDDARDRLDTALVAPARMSEAHDNAIELALEIADELVTAAGNGSSLLSRHARLLFRDATMLLVTTNRQNVHIALNSLARRGSAADADELAADPEAS
jgi:alkylation response protein AidB-like acyl-CoA dehydrogenase